MEIQGFPNYLIYEDGRVWSKNSGRFLKYGTDTHNYHMVILRHNGKSHNKKIHRLIGEHYIPNPKNLKCIDHINRIRTDNRIENLRWVSYQDNSRNSSFCHSNTGHQGVSYIPKRDRYRASYTIDRKTYCKYYKNLEDAIAWRKEMVDNHYNRPNPHKV